MLLIEMTLLKLLSRHGNSNIDTSSMSESGLRLRARLINDVAASMPAAFAPIDAASRSASLDPHATSSHRVWSEIPVSPKVARMVSIAQCS